MLLINKGKEFELSYNGIIHVIPEGEFHCSHAMGIFIKTKNKEWEKINIEVLDDTQELIDLKTVVPVKKEEMKEEIKEEVKEEKGEISKEVSK